VIGHGTPEQMQNSKAEDVRQFMSGLPDGPVAYHYPADALDDDLFDGEAS